MAGGYFDLPIASSRRCSPGDAPQDRRSPLEPYTPPLSTPSELPNDQTTPTAGAHAAKPRAPGILKSANRVKFNVSGSEAADHPYAILPDAQTPTQDMPQKPVPAARAASSEKDHRYPLVDTSVDAPGPAPGITVGPPRTSPPAIVWEDEAHPDKGRAIQYARERAQRLASLLSRPTSGNSGLSPRYSLPSSVASTPSGPPSDYGEDIPMISLPEKQGLHATVDEEDDDEDEEDATGPRRSRTSEAHRLVRQMARRDPGLLTRVRARSPSLRSGQVTPMGEADPDTYVEPPTHYRGGILSSLLKLYDQPSHSAYDRGRRMHSRQSSSGDVSSRGLSPDPGWKPQRPRKWYDKSPRQSTASLVSTAKHSPVPTLKHSRSNSSIGRRLGRPKLEDEIRITVHIAEILSRQKYLLRLCRALIRVGAPTHRLEEYMTMTARVLEIDMQCLYIPGCMIVSFGDASTHTTEMNLVRSIQGCDLGKMADVHEIYKEVIHDVIGVEEAIQRLEEVMKRKKRFSTWIQILMHGFACAMVGPFAFQARPIDMPIAFLLGCLVGALQLVLSPRSNIYSNIFEISAAVLTSFLARAFGSITYGGTHLFCFSSLAQSSIALILPGYIMLCASLELQSRNIVAGSVRLVYAIIYSLFLGFGITIGTALYGLIDPTATTDYTCPNVIPNEYVRHFPFVVAFTFCLCVINQAKWKQMPAMLTISMAGYVVNYFSSKRFSTYAQISLPGAMGAFIIGVLGNLYSRLRHGVAAAAMLPAIFVLVPSGLAASGSLVAGIASAEELTKDHNPYTIVTNGTQGFMDAAMNMTKEQHSTVVLDIGYGMVQIAIAFTVGLFLAAMVVYPFGKKRSGLFSF